MGNALLLTERDVRSVLTMPDLIQAMEGALAQFSSGGVKQPVRSVIEVGEHRNYFGIMPAALDNPPAVGAKLVTVYEGNHQLGLTSHLATIVLLDHDTGALQAVMDGRYITEARTAAVSAVSVKHLARPDASVLGILGTGVQARSHLEAIRHVRQLSDVRVWSPNAAHRARFVEDMRAATNLPIRAAASAVETTHGADLIVIASSSRTPVVEDANVAAGAHIAAVGACRPDQREMPTSLVARARVFVDSRAAARVEAGDILLPISEGAITDAHIAGELGELVAGRATGRTDGKQVTIFKSLGLAVEDMVAAHLALTRARTAGLGHAVSW